MKFIDILSKPFYGQTVYTFIITILTCIRFSISGEFQVFPFGVPNFPTHNSFAESHVKYLQSQKLKSEQFTQISILNTYFSAFNTENCLIVIDNYPKENIPPSTNNPVLLRNPHPSVVSRKTTHLFRDGQYSISDFSFAWVQATSHLINKTFTLSNLTSCPLSKYFVSYLSNIAAQDYIRDICLQLDLLTFSSHTKSWQCQQHFGIYPSWSVMNSVNDYNLVNILSGIKNYGEHHQTVPTPVIHVLVIKKSIREFLLARMYKIRRDEIYQDPGVLSDVILFCVVNGDVDEINSSVSHEITHSLEVLKQCAEPQCTDGYLATPISSYPTSVREAWALLSFSVPAKHELLSIYVSLEDKNPYLFLNKMVKTLSSCSLGNVPTQLEVRNSLTQSGSSINKLGHAFASVWHTILGNYTMFLEMDQECINGRDIWWWMNDQPSRISLKFVARIRDLHYSPFPIPDPFDNLRFISCGKGDVTAIQFLELINVFDQFTWIFIFIFTIVISVTQFVTFPRKEISIHIVSTLRVFMEQGSPFPNQIINISALRYATGLFLLMGIIISNAYKNTNVYNMIIPRQPIPFEKFEDLVLHNFTVYTRTTAIETLRLDNHYWHMCKGVSFKKDIYDFCVHSHVSNELQKVTNILYPDNSHFYARMNSSINMHHVLYTSSKIVSHGVVNFSKLHSVLKHTIENLNQSMLLYYDYVEKEIRRVRELEDLALSQSLKKCKNVALILPEHQCGRIWRDFSTQKQLLQVSLGTQVYSDFWWYVVLHGHVPAHVITNFNGIGTSGIWEFWTRLITSEDGEVSAELKTTPSPVSMDGNAVIVSILWLSGIACGICGFLCEIIKTKLFPFWIKDLSVVTNFADK